MYTKISDAKMPKEAEDKDKDGEKVKKRVIIKPQKLRKEKTKNYNLGQFSIVNRNKKLEDLEFNPRKHQIALKIILQKFCQAQITEK